MYSCQALRRSLAAGEHDQVLSRLYALDGADSSLAAARARFPGAEAGFDGKTLTLTFEDPGKDIP